MPIYEYTCKDCGKHFETLRSMKDADAPIHCIQCDSQNTVRQVSTCYAQSAGRAMAGSSSSSSSSSSGCGGCSGGTCSSCGH